MSDQTIHKYIYREKRIKSNVYYLTTFYDHKQMQNFPMSAIYQPNSPLLEQSLRTVVKNALARVEK